VPAGLRMPLTPQPGPPVDRRAAAAERTRTELLAEIDTLHGILASAPVIEQAKGAIMLCRRMSADKAFAVLSRYSQQHNIKIRDLAAQVADTMSTRPARSRARDLIDRLLADHTTPHRGPPTNDRSGGIPADRMS